MTIDRSKFWELYNQGKSDREISDECSVKHAIVAAWRCKHELPVHKKPRKSKSMIDKNEFEMMYYDGVYPAQMAEKLGIPYKSLLSWMCRHGYYIICPSNQALALDMYNAGATDTDIAMALNTTAAAIGTWRSHMCIRKKRDYMSL